MILEKAKSILRTGYVCDHCLGRQFAQLLTGTGNEERGKSLRYALALEFENKAFKADKSNFSVFSFRKRKINDKQQKLSGLTNSKETEKRECSICGNIFGKLEFWSGKAIEKLKKYEFSTFLAGVKLNDDLVMKEENLWDNAGLEWAESIKSEINREFGKIVEKSLKKKVDFENPDVLIILNLQEYGIEINVRSVFVYARYNKLVRGIPQTRWDKYDISVEELIGEPMKKMFESKDYILHGMGREDIDARCLGWRPFVMEMVNPKKRKVDLKKLEAAVNKSKKVQIKSLRCSDRKEMVDVKASKSEKSYKAIVEFEKPVENIESVKKIVGKINQETPNRVMHRRADKERLRHVKTISWKKISSKKYEFKITGDAGLYIKELISGDNGRTRPSVSGILKNKGIVKELDVIEVKA
ncbi:MAG: tRNA pseudouridine(54/55) synthase Pus10 [Candidatus Aenigmarchaeota archaeon]|nr:tRNA pseudouridine(54/55) synthase Pus10 [Candidatus Aenigmarchaeota archaeon]